MFPVPHKGRHNLYKKHEAWINELVVLLKTYEWELGEMGHNTTDKLS
jgi:hypothetical protein